jgi:hypothetical protein
LTVAGAVEQLQVYKTGRQAVGLHWSRPLRTYGDLAEFTVSYESVGNKGGSVMVGEAKARCVVWPDSYCHTVDGLDPDTNYTFTVRENGIQAGR